VTKRVVIHADPRRTSSRGFNHQSLFWEIDAPAVGVPVRRLPSRLEDTLKFAIEIEWAEPCSPIATQGKPPWRTINRAIQFRVPMDHAFDSELAKCEPVNTLSPKMSAF